MDADATLRETGSHHRGSRIAREGRAIVFVINKWDLIDQRQRVLGELHEKLDRLLPQVAGAGMVVLSAATGQGMDRLMPAVMDADRIWNTRVSTSELNRFLKDAVAPPATGRPRAQHQAALHDPSQDPAAVFHPVRKPAERASRDRICVTWATALRKHFGLTGTPLRFSYPHQQKSWLRRLSLTGWRLLEPFYRRRCRKPLQHRFSGDSQSLFAPAKGFKRALYFYFAFLRHNADDIIVQKQRRLAVRGSPLRAQSPFRETAFMFKFSSLAACTAVLVAGQRTGIRRGCPARAPRPADVRAQHIPPPSRPAPRCRGVWRAREAAGLVWRVARRIRLPLR